MSVGLWLLCSGFEPLSVLSLCRWSARIVGDCGDCAVSVKSVRGVCAQ